MTARVVVVDEAEEQLHEMIDWWVEHRSVARDLLADEFERCVSLLKSTPEIGTRFQRAKILDVRRLLMRRTKNFVYSVYDRERAVVYIIAVWGAPKEGEPILRDPR